MKDNKATEGSRGTRHSRKSLIIGGVGALLLATTIIAVSSTAQKSDSNNSRNEQVGSTSTNPGVTRTYTNRGTNLLLTAGGIGPSGVGKVFGRLAANGDRVQSFNLLRDKIIARGVSRGDTLRCVDTNNRSQVFTASCAANKASQKWAHKVVVKAPGAFADQVLIQNFATKKCMAIGQETGRGTATLVTKTCNRNDETQRWTQGTFVQ